MVYKSKYLNTLQSLRSFYRRSQSLNIIQQKRFFGASNASLQLKQPRIELSITKAQEEKSIVQFPNAMQKSQMLGFVKDRPQLQQIYIRAPNDGYYPRIKGYTEYDQSDVRILISEGQWAEMSNVLSAMTKDGQTSQPSFITFLAASLHDKSFELTHLLYEKMKELELPLNSIVLNFLITNAAQFQQYGHLVQLLFEATIADIQVDINTYLKMLSQVYFSYEVEFDRKDFITYLYILFDNDHQEEDFQHGSLLLQEYIEQNFAEFNAIREESKRRAKALKNKQKQDQVTPDSQNNEDALGTDSSTVGDEAEDDYQSQEGGAPELINEMNRTSLYRQQINKSKNNLKKQNQNSRKNRSQYSINQTSKHLNKYNNQQPIQAGFSESDQGVEHQIVVDIGHLKDLDLSPSNIKELSNMMANQITTMITNEAKKINNERESLGRNSIKPQLQQTLQKNNNLQDNILKFDTTTYRKKENHQQGYTKGANNQQINIRDERFSLETFYNSIGESPNQQTSVAKEEPLKQDEKQYLTTQEEATTEGAGLQQRSGSSAASDKGNQSPYDTDAREDHERKSIIKEEFKETILDKREHQKGSSGDERSGIPNKK